MDLSDEDPFALSDDEAMETVSNLNPVEEHLLKQKHDIIDRVERAKTNVEETKQLSNKILKRLQMRATCGESSGSDSDSDMYQVTGEPVVKKRCTRRSAAGQPLVVLDVWQKVVDDKWIVGIVLNNTTNRILESPRLYVCVKNERETRGITSFWTVIGESLWTRTEELNPDSEKLVATVVLDLPSFENDQFFEGFGTVAYVHGDKPLQTAIPTFRLTATEAIDRSHAPRFTGDPENSVLAIKAASIERTVSISLEKDPGRGVRLLEFIEDRGFKEIVSDVYVSKNYESFRHCVFEILPFTESLAMVRISARSSRQLNIIAHMLREKFPDMDGPNTDLRLMEAAIALEKELQLELAGIDAGAIHLARIRTDLLIP